MYYTTDEVFNGNHITLIITLKCGTSESASQISWGMNPNGTAEWIFHVDYFTQVACDNVSCQKPNYFKPDTSKPMFHSGLTKCPTE